MKSEIQKTAVHKHFDFQSDMAAHLALDTAEAKGPTTGGSRTTRGGGHRTTRGQNNQGKRDRVATNGMCCMVDDDFYGAIYGSIHPTRHGNIKGTNYCLSDYCRSGTIIMIFTVYTLRCGSVQSAGKLAHRRARHQAQIGYMV